MEKKRWMCRMLLTLFFLAGLAGTQALAAEEEGIYHLGEVVVSGKKKGVEKVGTTHTVTAEQIKERGARSLDEALKLVPGVQVRTAGDGAPRIDVRGFRTRHVTLLLNGTPYNSTNDGQFDPGLISVENIAEIRVTTGGSSMLYGSGGNAGVINIITKKATKGFGTSLGTELGEAGTTLLRGTTSYGSDKWDIFVSGSSYDRDRFLLSNSFSHTPDQPNDSRRNSDRERDNLFANIGFSPTDATNIGFTVSQMQGERGKPPVTNAGVDEWANNLRFEREDDAENFSTQLAFSHDFTGPLSIKGWGYYNSLDLLENGYDDRQYRAQTRNNSYRTDSNTEIAGGNLQLRYDAERYGAATLGLMVENDDWESDGFTIARVGGVNNVRTDFKDDADFQLYSVNFEYEVELLTDLGLVLGFGQHWQDRDEKTDDDFTYLAGLSYQLFEATRLKASHSRKVRFPTLRDLYDPQRGNPELDTEVSRHYEAGIEQQLPGVTFFTITAFYADIEDYIERRGTSDIVQNFDEYELKGFEVALENRYFERLWVRAAYDYLDTEDKTRGSNRPRLQYRPEHRTSLESSYELPWGFSAYGALWWVADSYFNARGANEFILPQKKLENYVLVDCRVNKATNFGGGVLDIYLGVNNLFDEDYEQSYGLPQAGQFIYGGVNWKF